MPNPTIPAEDSKTATAAKPSRPPAALAPGLALGLPAAAFAGLAAGVGAGWDPAADGAVLRWLHGLSGPALDTAFIAITTMGDGLVLAAVAAATAIALAWRGHIRPAAVLFLSVWGAAAANLVLKQVFERARPELWQQVVSEHGFSFPSGHAMASSAFALAIIALTWRTRWRWPAALAAGVFMLLVGLSRLYLGVHYPTDVLAGWCAGAALAVAVVILTPWLLRFLRLAK